MKRNREITRPERLGKSHYWKKGKIAASEHLTVWPISGNKLFVSWKLFDVKKELVSSYFEKPFSSFPKVLRIYDVTHILFNGSNAHRVQEISLKEGQQNSIWHELQPNRCYITELGIKLSEKEFFPLLRSNAVQLPSKDANQLGKMQKKINHSLPEKNTVPQWVDHVSTYSYYESMLKKNDE